MIPNRTVVESDFAKDNQIAGVGEGFFARVMHLSAKAERRHVQIPLRDAIACRVQVLVSNVAVVG